MGWMIAAIYLGACLVAPFVFALFWVNGCDEKIEMNNGERVFEAFIFCLFWPLSITMITLERVQVSRKRKITDDAKSIISRHNMERISQHDRSGMILIPENDLKFLLKYHRKDYFDLNKQLLEMVRDELMNREAERNLLGVKHEKSE
jgi:hypothetical protein